MRHVRGNAGVFAIRRNVSIIRSGLPQSHQSTPVNSITATDSGVRCKKSDEKFFLGRLDYLRALRFEQHVAVPLLRKDFMLAPVQLYEARSAGADAILLIVAALDDATLCDLHALARSLGLTALVEAHAADEVERALRIPGLQLLGVNNRNLHTFEVRRQTALELRGQVPVDIAMVSESGIFTAEHVAEVAAAGLDAILVGEALVTAPDIAQKVRELVS